MTSFLGTLAKLKCQILRKTCPSMDFSLILISHLLAEYGNVRLAALILHFMPLVFHIPS